MFKRFRRQKRIYLDYAAATPVRTAVLEAMAPYFSVRHGNPGGIHKEGQVAKDAVERAREEVARTLRVRATDVIFTGSGTESNNLALYGVSRYLVEEREKQFDALRIVSTKIEHPSILGVLEHLASRGVIVDYVRVDENGLIDTKHLESLLTQETALVTFAYANSEIGVVQDVKRITRTIKKYNTEHGANILTHLDASQAPLWLPCELDTLGVDLMTLDAGKCYGPKGVGVLAMRHGVNLKAVQLGGGQERGLRSGTENVSLIVGCAKALAIAKEGMTSRSAVVAALRDVIITELLKIDGTILNGSREHRIANNVNISIPGIDTEFAVVTLDAKGIACSTKSACSGKDSSGSSVVQEISGDETRARSTIRFSLGEETTHSDIKKTIRVLGDHIIKTRAFDVQSGVH